MNIRLIGVILFSLSSLARADAWLVAAETALLADMATTLDISHDCRNGGNYHETNPILGRCPSRGEVYGYFVAAGVGTWLVSRWLPPRPRKWFLGAVILIETGYVAHNLSIGVRFRF